MSIRSTKTRLALLAAALTFVVPALAQPAPPIGQSLTLARYQQRGEARLMAADTDGDGRVSKAEFMAAEQGGRDPTTRFARLDANNDGMIDKSEVDAMLAARFHRLDANGDGVLTPDERAAMHRGRDGGGRKSGGGSGAPGE